MDAISFVLGVRARHLRSNELKDLIFKVDGEPAGRLRACVTLVYEVSEDEVEGMEEGSELLFTRLVSPSGIGSYRINNREATWDDYDKKLRAIGILVKARNFLVFQGDVESIASKSPKELTAFFEQISGSEDLKAEYERLKGLKDTAEENTIFSFQKKKGITAEKKHVREQKEEAERFNEKRLELASLKQEYHLWQLFHIEAEMEGHQGEIASIQSEVQELEVNLKSVDGQHKQKKREQAKKNRAVAGFQKQVQKQQREVTTMEPQEIKLREQMRHCKQQMKSDKETAAKLDAESKTQAKEVRMLEKDITKLQEALQELDSKSTSASAEDSSMRLQQGQLEEYQKIKEQARIKTAKLHGGLDAISRQQAADQDRLDHLNSLIDDLLKNKKQIADESGELKDRETKVAESIKATRKTIKEGELELKKLNEHNATAGTRRKKLSDELQQVQTTLRSAKDDRRQNKHDQAMAECLVTLKRLFPGVQGRLVDLCKPTQRKYNMAVTVATGKNMDAIVVDNQKTGLECIQYMREQRVGTASFIPLDKIKVKPINERLRTLGPKYKLLIDIVQCDVAIQPALQYAVGNTILCENLDDARSLCFGSNERVKAVTVQGAVISKAGTMTGGTTSKDSDRAQRWDEQDERKIADCKRRKEELEAELAELQRDIGTRGGARQLQDVQTSVEGQKNRLKFAEADHKVTKEKLDVNDEQFKGVERQLRKVKPEQQNLQSTLASRNKEIKDTETKISKIKERLFADFSRSVGVTNIHEYEQKTVEREKEEAARRRHINDHTAKLQAQLDYTRSRDLAGPLAKLRKSLTAAEQRLKDLDAKKQEVAEKQETAKEQLKDKQDDHAAAVAQLHELEVEIKAVVQDRNKVKSDLTALGKRISAEEAHLERLRAKRHEVLQKAHVDEVDLPRLDGESSRIEIEDEDNSNESETQSQVSGGSSTTGFSQSTSSVVQRDNAATTRLDFSSLKRHRNIDGPREYEKISQNYLNQVAELASEVDRMQPNMKALEKFADVQARLKATGADFEKAKESAQEASAQFDMVKQERYQKFMAAYNHISSTLGDIYKDLTRSSRHPLGGTAYLSLDDTEEPYSAGIKYNAMPPMKRFRDMEQLSGGEKTVAALALLFAIHSFNPSPFFVMDEVDAALDNVNVNKVSSYIKEKCAPEFQCIVISLKDMFYEKADSLIGIFRNAPTNSSSTLTLDMEQFETTS
jgi:structural maintenance of chromosome 1